MGDRAAWSKMAAMCGRSTLLASNADEASSVLYISMVDTNSKAAIGYKPDSLSHQG